MSSLLTNFWLKYRDIIYIIAILVVVAFSIDTCQKAKFEKKVSAHNIDALLDSMQTITSNLNGEISYRDALLIDKDQLEKTIGINKKQIKELNKKLESKVAYISKLEGTISILNKQIDSVTYIKTKDVYTIRSREENPYYKLSFTNTFELDSLDYSLYNINSNIDYLNIPININTGLTKDWTIFVTSDNPYVEFTNVQGAVIDKDLYTPKRLKNRWALFVGVGMAAGYNVVEGEGFSEKGGYAGPGVMVGISYNIITW